jgi:hypothetical protein
MHPGAERHYVGSIPAVGGDARIYYYVEVTWPSAVNQGRHLTPSGGPADPLVYFVSDRHTADLDVDDALLDIFDAVRLIRHIAWSEPVRGAAKLDHDGDGVLGRRDLEATLRLLLRGMDRGEPPTNRLRDALKVAVREKQNARLVESHFHRDESSGIVNGRPRDPEARALFDEIASFVQYYSFGLQISSGTELMQIQAVRVVARQLGLKPPPRKYLWRVVLSRDPQEANEEGRCR